MFGQQRVFILLWSARKISLVGPKKFRQNFHSFLENTPPSPPPLEKTLDPPLFVSIFFIFYDFFPVPPFQIQFWKTYLTLP